MNSWRIAGVALMAGTALFLVFIVLKLLLIAAAAVLLLRVVGGRLMGRTFGGLGRGDWPSGGIVSIDAPAYRSSGNRADYARVISID